MNEQNAPTYGAPADEPRPSPHPGPHSGPQSGPRVDGEQMRDVDRLRRSTTDRYVAGVAGGLGRHLDVDPTIIRVLLAVLTFFGGAGVLVYAAVWLFVPEDGAQRAPIDLSPDVRRIVLVATGAISLLIVFGSPFFGDRWGWSFPLPLLVLGLVVLALFGTRRHRRRTPPPPPWGPATGFPATAPSTTAPSASAPSASAPSATAPSQEGTAMSSTPTTDPAAPTRSGEGDTLVQEPPSWTPPPPRASVPPPPPRPRRTGLVLFWPTLALVAIALGTLGVVDASASVPVSAYAALAVAVVGVMLVVGAFVGRPGGLIALGLVGTLALVVTSVVGATVGGAVRDEDVQASPTSAAQVLPSYGIGTGSLTLDLTGVADVASLDGRSIRVSARAGEVRVLLPRGLDADVDVAIRYAGQIDLETAPAGRVYSVGGFDKSVRRTLTTTAAAGTPTIDLVVRARVGHVVVEQN